MITTSGRVLLVAALLTGCVSPTGPRYPRVGTRSAAWAPAGAPPSGAEFSLATAQEAAPEPEPASPWEKLSVSIGGLVSTVDSSVRFGGEGIGILVDLEGALGLDTSKQVYTADLVWRFSENRKHRLDLSYRDMRRSASRVLKEELEIGDDIVIPIGARVDTRFDIDMFKGVYSYSLIQDDRVDLALAAGLYVQPIRLALESGGQSVEDFDITAPLPLVGLRTDVALTRQLFLRTSLELFYIAIDQYQGALREITVGIEWVPVKHLGLGLSLESYNLVIEGKEGTDVPGVDFLGRIESGYVGALVYLRAYL